MGSLSLRRPSGYILPFAKQWQDAGKKLREQTTLYPAANPSASRGVNGCIFYTTQSGQELRIQVDCGPNVLDELCEALNVGRVAMHAFRPGKPLSKHAELAYQELRRAEHCDADVRWHKAPIVTTSGRRATRSVMHALQCAGLVVRKWTPDHNARYRTVPGNPAGASTWYRKQAKERRAALKRGEKPAADDFQLQGG